MPLVPCLVIGLLVLVVYDGAHGIYAASNAALAQRSVRPAEAAPSRAVRPLARKALLCDLGEAAHAAEVEVVSQFAVTSQPGIGCPASCRRITCSICTSAKPAARKVHMR